MKLFLFLFIISVHVFSVGFEENELYQNYAFLYGNEYNVMLHKHQEQVKNKITPLKRQQELAEQVKRLTEEQPDRKEEFLLKALIIIQHWASQEDGIYTLQS